MWSSFKLISHPDRTLDEHLASCNEISFKLLDFKYLSDSFLPKEELQSMRQVLVFFHDFGKGTDFFQSKIIDATERENFTDFILQVENYINLFKKERASAAKKLLGISERLSNHAKLGAYFFFSHFSHPNPIIECILLKIIRHHHGGLTNFSISLKQKPQILLDEESLKEIEIQLEYFNFELYQKILLPYGYTISLSQWSAIKGKFISALKIRKIERQLVSEKSYLYFFLQHYLFSILLSADKGDMMLERGSEKSNLIRPKRLVHTDVISDYKTSTIKKSEEKSIDTDREKAYQDIGFNALKFGDNNFFSITLPTGMGKTFSAYNAAIILQHKYFNQTGSIPRIVYCLPFTSIIDQNSQILSDIFSNSNVVDTTWIAKNHYLSTYNDKYDERELKNNEGEFLADGWEQEVIVTTFVQLLESIFTNKNRALRKFHNITNAVIILDEIQSIPAKYYEVIEDVFKHMALYFNTKFLFVTATQPFLFSNQDDIIELTDPDKRKTRVYFETLRRIEIDQSLLKNFNYESIPIEQIILIFQNDIALNPDKSFLIICNTIGHSQEVYKQLSLKYPDKCLIYLSGSILPKFRKDLVKEINENTKNRKVQIVISTQVVEAGVDIDLDIVYRDFAPLDSINQSAGRCNRNGIAIKGIVKLFQSGKSHKIYDSILLSTTIDILSKYPAVIEERELYNLNLKYAKKIRNKITDFSDTSLQLKRALQELQLETIAENFKLVEEDNYAYNVFIPYSEEAKILWNSYLALFKIEDFFEKKKSIKKIKPTILQYVTRFPKNKYKPNDNQKNKLIIYESDWQNYYDLKYGFKLSDKNNFCVII